MAQHLVAWYESVAPGGALTAIAAVPDETVYSVGDDIRVPEGLNNIIGAAALINDASADSAQIQSPSLRAMANIDIEPIVAAAVFGTPPEVLYHPQSPNPVAVAESLQFYVKSAPAAAVEHYGLVHLADGPVQPVAGNIITVKATGAANLSAGQWVNTALTFDQTLPVGTYQVVGMRARGTNLVAARLVFKGGQWRPGVAAVNAIGDRDLQSFRYGRCGVLGSFHTNTPPSVDCLGVTDTSQDFLLDLIKTG